jgi:hypothetical protein
LQLANSSSEAPGQSLAVATCQVGAAAGMAGAPESAAPAADQQQILRWLSNALSGCTTGASFLLRELPTCILPRSGKAHAHLQQQLLQDLQQLQRQLTEVWGIVLICQYVDAAREASTAVEAARAVRAEVALTGQQVEASAANTDENSVCTQQGEATDNFSTTGSSSRGGCSTTGSQLPAQLSALLPGLGSRLVACGEALAALCPVPLCCNNPGCVELQGASELQLVAGNASRCSQCRCGTEWHTLCRRSA